MGHRRNFPKGSPKCWHHDQSQQLAQGSLSSFLLRSGLAVGSRGSWAFLLRSKNQQEEPFPVVFARWKLSFWEQILEGKPTPSRRRSGVDGGKCTHAGANACACKPVCFCIRGWVCVSVSIYVFPHMYVCVCWALYTPLALMPLCLYVCTHTYRWVSVCLSVLCLFVRSSIFLCIYVVCVSVWWLTTMRKCVYRQPRIPANLLKRFQRASIHLSLDCSVVLGNFMFHLIKWAKIMIFSEFGSCPVRPYCSESFRLVAETKLKNQLASLNVMFKINPGSKAPWARMSMGS